MAGAKPRSESVDFLSVWPRVERALRTRAAKAGLVDDETDELLHRVQLALLRKAEFSSARGAERYGLAVTRHAVGLLLARRAESAGVQFVPLDGVEHVPAPDWEDPETRAVFRADSSAALRRVLPRLSAVEREALMYPLRRIADEKQDQLRWAVRLHRARRKLEAAVDELLAPVVLPVWKVRTWLRERSFVMSSALAGAVLTVAPILVIAGGGSVSRASGDAEARDGVGTTRLAVTRASWPSGDRLLVEASARPANGTNPRSSPSGPRADRPPIILSTGVRDTGGAAEAQVELSFAVPAARGQNGGNEFRATVGCDSPTRALVCEALRAYVLPVATEPGS